MLYLHDLYNADKIFIYIIKLPGPTSSHLRVETQEKCVPKLNEEYTYRGDDRILLH